MGLLRGILGRKQEVPLVAEFPGLSAWGTGFVPDTELVAVGLQEEIRLIDLAQHSVVKTLRNDVRPRQIRISRDGTRLASFNKGRGTKERKMVEVWDIVGGEKLQAIELHSVEAIAISPDGNTLAAGHGGYRGPTTVDLLDLSTGEVTLTLKGHGPSVVRSPLTHGVNDVDFSPDGRYLVSVGDDAKAIVWDLNNEEGQVLSSHEYVIRRVCFSHSGKSFATGGAEPWMSSDMSPLVGIREVETDGSDIFKVESNEPVKALAYSRDDSHILVACRDHTVWVWSGKPTAKRIDHDFGRVKSLSLDAARLASEKDKVLMIWDVSDLVR
jgi:WD40 repeat protein